jgi:hypothetical protein
MLPRDGTSLLSRFKPGTLGAVAERISDIAPNGPRELLRECRSSVRTRLKLRVGLLGAETFRFVTAPGRERIPDVLADLANFGRPGVTATGPPSFRLMASHCLGRRDAKLDLLERTERKMRTTHNGTITSVQNSRKTSAATFCGAELVIWLVLSCFVLVVGLPSAATDCHIQSLST